MDNFQIVYGKKALIYIVIKLQNVVIGKDIRDFGGKAQEQL